MSAPEHPSQHCLYTLVYNLVSGKYVSRRAHMKRIQMECLPVRCFSMVVSSVAQAASTLLAKPTITGVGEYIVPQIMKMLKSKAPHVSSLLHSTPVSNRSRDPAGYPKADPE